MAAPKVARPPRQGRGRIREPRHQRRFPHRRKIVEAITINGFGIHLEDGPWALVRASSNKRELVMLVESMRPADDMRALLH